MSYQRRLRLGAGYFGEVWLEYDDALRRLCASKYINPARLLPGADVYAEAQAMVLSSHENVVKVYAADKVGVIPVIRMEYLRRGSLADEYNGAALPLGDAVRAIEQACRGVEHIHAHGLLHRDIKPANLMLGDDGVVKVSDFGLANMIGNVAGAPPWSYIQHLPPENLYTGRGIDSEAGDVYALGVTAYRLVNGDSNFRSSASTAKNIKAAIQSGKYPDRDKWLPHVHPALRKVIRKAMRVQTPSRYKSAALFRHALEGVQPVVSWRQLSFGDDVHWEGNAAATGTAWQAMAVTNSNSRHSFSVSRKLDGKAWRNMRADSEAFDTRLELDNHASRVLGRIGALGR